MLPLPTNDAHVSSEVGFPVLIGEAVEEGKAHLCYQRIEKENYAQDRHFYLVFDIKLPLVSFACEFDENPNEH